MRRRNLDFTVWNYAVDIVQDNIDLFQEANPEITVQLSDFAWPVFHETMVNRFISKTPTDVTYNGGNWLNEFAAAGWVVSARRPLRLGRRLQGQGAPLRLAGHDL